MKILVVGGSYFIGRVFVESLFQEQAFQISLVNRGNQPLNLESVTELVCDRNDTARLRDRVGNESWDAVVDFCAYGPEDVRGLFQALAPNQVGHYILVSTVSVYAPCRDLPVTEKARLVSAPQPELGPASHYGYRKVLAEKSCAAALMRDKVPFTILRPSIVYGRYNYAPRESWFFRHAKEDMPLVLPDNDLALFSFLLVDDLARAVNKSLGNERVFGQAMNLCGAELVSYKRIVEVLEKVTGKSMAVQTWPVSRIDAERLPLPFPLDSHLVYSGTRAGQLLDMDYTPFEQGMKNAWQWWLNEQEGGHGRQ